ncbi:hypothetical protein HN747_05020 [archaeon]|nr:hypothetical protein [archaeon]
MKNDDITKKETSLEDVEIALAGHKDTDMVLLVELPNIPQIESILHAYPEELRGSIKLSKKQVTALLLNVKISTFGVNNTLPMICNGDSCPVAKHCFFYKAQIHPEGERCPPEIMFLDQMVPQLIVDMGVDMENYLEVNIVQEYASELLTKRRADNMIAIYGDVNEVATSVIQATGTALYTEQETPYVVIRDRAVKRMGMLRKEMLATREQRAKYKLTGQTDPSTRAAEIREAYEARVAAEKLAKANDEKELDGAFKQDLLEK